MLESKNVSYTYIGKYQKNEVLHSVTCEFKEGQMYALIGPSGSGKTTLLSLLAGLDLPTDGEICYNSVPTSKIDRDRYRRETVSVVYQSFNLFPLLTAMENVAFPMRILGHSKKEANEVAKRHISALITDESILHKRPLMMSGGEQQRIAIARAMVAGGKILLADEPTGNLDLANGAAVVDILKILAHEKGFTVVVVTHNMEVAEQADFIYKLADGRIVQ